MGICLECFGGSSDEYTPVQSSNTNEPDKETKRKQLAEAAEKRLKEQESKGIKDPGKVRRNQKKKEELEKQMENQGTQEGPLRWQVG